MSRTCLNQFLCLRNQRCRFGAGQPVELILVVKLGLVLRQQRVRFGVGLRRACFLQLRLKVSFHRHETSLVPRDTLAPSRLDLLCRGLPLYGAHGTRAGGGLLLAEAIDSQRRWHVSRSVQRFLGGRHAAHCHKCPRGVVPSTVHTMPHRRLNDLTKPREHSGECLLALEFAANTTHVQLTSRGDLAGIRLRLRLRRFGDGPADHEIIARSEHELVHPVDFECLILRGECEGFASPVVDRPHVFAFRHSGGHGPFLEDSTAERHAPQLPLAWLLPVDEETLVAARIDKLAVPVLPRAVLQLLEPARLDHLVRRLRSRLDGCIFFHDLRPRSHAAGGAAVGAPCRRSFLAAGALGRGRHPLLRLCQLELGLARAGPSFARAGGLGHGGFAGLAGTGFPRARLPRARLPRARLPRTSPLRALLPLLLLRRASLWRLLWWRPQRFRFQPLRDQRLDLREEGGRRADRVQLQPVDAELDHPLAARLRAPRCPRERLARRAVDRPAEAPVCPAGARVSVRERGGGGGRGGRGGAHRRRGGRRR